MHDLRAIRENPAAFDYALARRGVAPASPAIIDLDRQRRAAVAALQGKQTQRNQLSQDIGQRKRRGEPVDAMMEEVQLLKDSIAEVDARILEIEKALNGELAILPSLPASVVPDGLSSDSNVELRRWGEATTPTGARTHDEIGEDLDMMDFQTAARMSGSRFAILKGPLARLERALGQFMVDLHTQEHGYREISPPLLVRADAVYGVGQLPKFAGDMFQTQSGHWLIPTAEVPLTNLVAGQILDEEDLPLRVTAITPCFRLEAGAAGRDTRGLIRQHQFSKVELVSITAPEDSATEHERMTAAAEMVLKRLGLPFRTMALCAGDLGFAAARTYDLEVWLPGQRAWREISSCSDCHDFQARRMDARCRPRGTKDVPRFVHTLNGSGVAVGRCLIAIMENCQDGKGVIAIPEALHSYMGGQKRIVRND